MHDRVVASRWRAVPQAWDRCRCVAPTAPHLYPQNLNLDKFTGFLGPCLVLRTILPGARPGTSVARSVAGIPRGMPEGSRRSPDLRLASDRGLFDPAGVAQRQPPRRCLRPAQRKTPARIRPSSKPLRPLRGRSIHRFATGGGVPQRDTTSGYPLASLRMPEAVEIDANLSRMRFCG